MVTRRSAPGAAFGVEARETDGGARGEARSGVKRRLNSDGSNSNSIFELARAAPTLAGMAEGPARYKSALTPREGRRSKELARADRSPCTQAGRCELRRRCRSPSMAK